MHSNVTILQHILETIKEKKNIQKKISKEVEKADGDISINIMVWTVQPQAH